VLGCRVSCENIKQNYTAETFKNIMLQLMTDGYEPYTVSLMKTELLVYGPPLPDTEGAGRRAGESLPGQSGSYSAKE
jgi:hypothetical protein